MLLEKVNRQHSVSLSLFLNLSLSLSVYLYLNLLLVKNSSKYFTSLKLVILVKNHDWKDISAACQMKTWRPKAGREREFVHFWPKIYMKLWCMIRLQLHISSHRLFNQHPMPHPQQSAAHPAHSPLCDYSNSKSFITSHACFSIMLSFWRSPSNPPQEM